MQNIGITVFTIVLGLLPSFIWLEFYREEHRKHPEPPKMLFEAFVVGAFSTFLVLPVQLFLNRQLSAVGVGAYSIPSFTVLAFTEELFKFLAVYFFLHRSRLFREPLDAMIYMITGGLGFAAVENIALLFNTPGASLLTITVVEQVVLRFVGATLLHSLASGLIGYFWGLGMLEPRKVRVLIALGILLATVLHALFNFLIIVSGPAGFAILFVILFGFFILSDFEKLKRLDS